MSDRFNQHDIQRGLITVEELLYKIRDSFIGYAGEENVPEVKEIDETMKQVRSLQEKMRIWFAP